MRISGEGSQGYGAEHYITLDGTEEEINLIKEMMAGIKWVSMKNGILANQSIYAPLPDPVADLLMQPFWRPVAQYEKDWKSTIEIKEFDKVDYKNHPRDLHSASLCLQLHT